MAFIGDLLNNVFNSEERSIRMTDNPFTIVSKSNIFTEDQLETALITPTVGKRIVIKGVTISSVGSAGEIHLVRGNGIPADTEINTNIILPLYLSRQNKVSPSANISIMLDVDESVNLIIDGITSGKEVFVGISYKEV